MVVGGSGENNSDRYSCRDDNVSEKILRYGDFIGCVVNRFDHLPRAMGYARDLIDQTEKDGCSMESGRVICARSLTASKGRFTRSWHAPPGGLWGCVIHASTLMPRSTMLLSLAVGVAACEALRGIGLQAAAIRWVNDVLFESKKLAGFLIESHIGAHYGEQYQLIGFGINLNNNSFPEELRSIATSASAELGCEVDEDLFFADFLYHMKTAVGLLYYIEAVDPEWAAGKRDGLHPLVEKWLELSDTMGKEVWFGNDVLTKPQYQATVVAVVDDGGLKMRLPDGHEIVEYSGEIRYL